jgi:hypothetical protein
MKAVLRPFSPDGVLTSVPKVQEQINFLTLNPRWTLSMSAVLRPFFPDGVLTSVPKVQEQINFLTLNAGLTHFIILLFKMEALVLLVTLMRRLACFQLTG